MLTGNTITTHEEFTVKLELLLLPTTDLAASLALFRDGLGFEEVWREGDTTAAITQPGSDLQIMLDAAAPDAPAGPIFVVDSVQAYHDGRAPGLTVIQEPGEIPGGFMAGYQDAGGVTIYVLDQSTEQAE
jgi:catechol 2,3-dioxygenase-like lactoylglutathione lyase family enzyme